MTIPSATRDPRGRFCPGVTGNPSGRPRGAAHVRRVERALPSLIERAIARAIQPDAPDELVTATLNAIVAVEMAAVLREVDQLAAPGGAA
jgi:hypothetical protein